jgi:hypothetical protein
MRSALPLTSFGNKMSLSINLFELNEGQDPKIHSKKLDKMYGYKIVSNERGLAKKYQVFYKPETDEKKHFPETQAWVGLHPQVLQTPYHEILEFLRIVKKYNPQKVLDLGAGYGRVGLVCQQVFPDCEFLGYEIVEERVAEANRIFAKWDYDNCQLELKNIIDKEFVIPDADIYFLYDFSNPKDLRFILNQLRKRVYTERFFLIVRGKGARSLIQMKYPEFWAAHGAIHKEECSVYSSFTDLV